MDPFFGFWFVLLIAITAAVKYSQRDVGTAAVAPSSGFAKLQQNYLPAFLLFKMADWMMGMYFLSFQLISNVPF